METEISPTDIPSLTFDEVSLERSKSFVMALQELKNLRPQLYSAADYCEKSYLHSEQKQMKLTFDPLARFLVSYQHWTFYPVMCVGRINLFIQTFLLLFSKRHVPDRALNIVGILIFWTWFPLLVSYLPNWQERIIFISTSFGVTAIQHIQFCLNHFAADVYTGPPNGNDWFEKQTAGTLDISCKPYMDWFFGGLQFQLEHHLFPRLPRCHLREVSPMVKELCKKHKLQYRSLSWWEANVWTIRTLKIATIQARGLLWEAVNTHG